MISWTHPSRIWDCESGNCIKTKHPTHDTTPMSVCLVVVICSISASFSPNDKYVLLSYLKKGLAVWCLEHDRIEQLEYVISFHSVES